MTQTKGTGPLSGVRVIDLTEAFLRSEMFALARKRFPGPEFADDIEEFIRATSA